MSPAAWMAVASTLGLALAVWLWVRAERAAARADADAKREVAENDAEAARMDNKETIEGMAKVQAVRDQAVVDTRNGTLPERLRDQYID